MASTYSTSLKLELIGNGDQSGTWGTTTNTNLGTLLEQAITGVQAITMANADYTLTNLNGASDEARNAVLVVGGTNSAIRNIIAPAVNKTYIIVNNTVGGFAILIKTSASTGITIANGTTVFVYCDGTEFYLAGPNITTSTANTPNTVVLRDGSGNFAAGTITATLVGNVTGNVTGNASGLSATLAAASGGTGITSAGTSGNVLTSNGTAWVSSAPASQGFASGTRMSFNQTSAPTGWTKDTSSTINDSILRLVTGTVSSGGSVAFSTWNTSGTTGSYTLSTSDIPSHTHNVTGGSNEKGGSLQFAKVNNTASSDNATSATGGGGSHSHTLSNNIKYYDFIIASKD